MSGLGDFFEGATTTLRAALETKHALQQATDANERQALADQFARQQAEYKNALEAAKLFQSDAQFQQKRTDNKVAAEDLRADKIAEDKRALRTRRDAFGLEEGRRREELDEAIKNREDDQAHALEVAKIKAQGVGGGVDLSKYSPLDILKAKNLIYGRFGRGAANKPRNVWHVLKAMEDDPGLTYDDLDDLLHESTMSDEFAASPIRTAFNSLAVNMTQSARDQLEIAIDERLQVGDEVGATKELMSGIVKQLSVSERKLFFNRQAMLASLSEIDQGLKALKAKGIIVGPGVAIENALKAKLRQNPNQAVARIIQRMENVFIQFRKTMSGVAFGDKESADYRRIFPSPDKNLNMNQAILDSLIATNLQTGRNAVLTIVPSLLEVVSHESLDGFLIGSVNLPEKITGVAGLSRDTKDGMIAKMRGILAGLPVDERKVQGDKFLADLQAKGVSEAEIEELLKAAGVR